MTAEKKLPSADDCCVQKIGTSVLTTFLTIYRFGLLGNSAYKRPRKHRFRTEKHKKVVKKRYFTAIIPIWDFDAAGSNPVTPTISSVRNGFRCEHFLYFDNALWQQKQESFDTKQTFFVSKIVVYNL